MLGVTNTALVVAALTLLSVSNRILGLPVSQKNIAVTEGQSFTFTCGPSADELEGITVTLNDNEPSEGIVTTINDTSPNGVIEYRYRHTTAVDDNTRIVCSAAQDEGVIYLTVFHGPIITNVDMNNFTIEEGSTLQIPLSVDVNPQPDSIILYYHYATVSNIFVNSTVIEFLNISRNQIGEYSLEISNNISTAMYNFTVNITYGPEFIDPYLPSRCYLIGTNATYNCSAVSEVIGNPQPSLRANVTQSGMNPVEVEVVDDTVTANGSNMAHSINITCVATNSIGSVATAVGSLNFGRAADSVTPTVLLVDAETIIVKWEAQTNTGCADVTYHGEVFLLDKISILSFNINRLVTYFNTTEHSYTIGNLCPETYYQISMQAANQLGISGYSNITFLTNKTELIITYLNAKRVDTNEVEVTWNLTTGGVNNLTITIMHRRIVNGIPQEYTQSVSADERMIVLNLEEASSYNITLHVAVTCKPNISATNSTKVDSEDDSGVTHTLSVAKLWQLIMTTILLLVVMHTL